MFKSPEKPQEPGNIEIIFDQTRQLTGAEYEIYGSNNDYVAAYVSLQTALKQQRAKRIIVYSQALQTWLVKGLSKYPFARVSARKMTYRDLLAAKWNIAAYDLDLTDLQIQQQKLLELEIEGTQPQSLSAFVCQEFLSPHLDTPRFNRLNFGALMTDLAQYHGRQERLPALAAAVYGYKLNLWAAHSPEFRELIQELQTNLWGLYEQACLYKLLAKYPRALQIKCLGEAWVKRFESARLNLSELDLKPFQQTSPLYAAILLKELPIFWRGFEKAHPDWTAQQIEELLGYCSGELPCEADYLLVALKSRMRLITSPLIARVQTTFRPLLPLYRQKIEELRAYARPAKPSPFNPAAEIQAVIDWAVQEYLPYKFWLETTGQTDPAALVYGRQFADYVCAHYERLSYHYERVLYRFIFNYKSLIAATPFPLLLIIDNFNYKFFTHFEAACAQHGLAGRVEPYLCLLPSETRSSKKGLISGKRDQTDRIQYSYEKTLLENWQAFFPQHALRYLAKAGELADYVVKGQELLVINYLEIDAELHKSFQKTALEHRQTVAFVLDHLTELLAHFIKRNHLESRARIFLISDHGSTLIPGSIPNEIEPEAFKGRALDSQYRFLTLSDAQFQTLAANANLADGVYFLDKTTSGDGRNYAIARGYNRFKAIQEDFYVHGGALPEELIVPVGYFEYTAPEAQNLRVQLVKTEYRLLTKETLILRIANPNALPARNISITVTSQARPLASIQLAELAGSDEIEVSQNIRLQHKEMSVLQIALVYEIAGNTLEETIRQPITIKTMTQSKFDFDF